MFSFVRNHFTPGERNVHKNYPVESMHFPTFFRNGEFEKFRENAFSGVLPFIVVRLIYGKNNMYSAIYSHFAHSNVIFTGINQSKACIFRYFL